MDERPLVRVGINAEPRPGAHPGLSLISILCMVMAFEGADMVTTYASFHALERDLGMGPSTLAKIAMAQSLMLAFTCPVWGVIADRHIMTRRAILLTGCIGWGTVTILIGAVSTIEMMIFLRGLNGCMVSCLGPISQGIVADTTAPTLRGRTFGLLMASHSVGMIVGNSVATILSHKVVFGIEGWRVTFFIVGVMSLLCSVNIAVFMREPYREPPPQQEGSFVESESRRLQKYLVMPSFRLLVFQSMIGHVPWHALQFLTMYFQLAGIADGQAAVLVGFATLTGAVGNLLGGAIGDQMAIISPGHGRTLTGEVTVICGMIPAAILFSMEPDASNANMYGFLLFVLYLTSSWRSAGVNRPLLTEIVAAEDRSSLLAWYVCMESSFAALFGNIAVGFFAENVFGYPLPQDHRGVGANPDKARALGHACSVVIQIPWAVSFFMYSLLHWYLPAELSRAKKGSAELP